MSTLPPFHLAFPVTSLAKARAFYGGLLGCPEGRSSEDWVDFDFHGHQIVAHLAPEEARAVAAHEVDGDAVPVRHFGLVLAMDAWQSLADRLRAAGTRFVVEPHIRFRASRANRRPCSCSTRAATPWSSRPSPIRRVCSRNNPGWASAHRTMAPSRWAAGQLTPATR
jgi:hypothetical protein